MMPTFKSTIRILWMLVMCLFAEGLLLIDSPRSTKNLIVSSSLIGAAPCSYFNTTEFDALYQIYEYLNGASWVYPLNSIPWNFTSDSNNPCNQGWAFLSCTYVDSTCSINTIEFRYLQGLEGTLPDVFNVFTNLQSLQLVGNSDLQGSLPLSLAMIPTLVNIGIISNALSGALPSSLFSLPLLSICNIYYNLISGPIPEVPEPGNKNLEYLVLTGNRLTGTIPSSLSNLTNVIELFLSYNHLDGTIPSAICQMTSVELFTVEGNTLTGTIPQCIGGLQYMAYFVAGTNQLTGSIPPSITTWQYVQKLAVGNTLLTGSIPEWTSYQFYLQYLDTSITLLTGSIPTTLSNLLALYYLFISATYISGTIPESFGGLVSINAAFLVENMLSGSLPASLGGLTTLQYLYLSENFISGSLPVEFIGMSNLQYLDIDKNNMVGSIPINFGTLPLHGFACYDNDMTGTIPITFNALNLTNFAIGNNHFTGSLPPLYNSSNIVYYTAYKNMFTGIIDPNTPKRPQLKIFSINNNYLSGSITNSYAAPALTNVYVQHNYFTGQLPYEFGKLIASIQVDYNYFTGSIHDDLALLPELNQFAISNNIISGTIPREMGLQQPHLTTLELSGNILTGTLPPTLFNGTAMAVFAAVSNCLQGSIPESICLSNRSLQSFSIDGFHAAAACQTPVFSFSIGTSTYKLTSRLLGTLPRCLLEEFDILETLHCSGNGLKGTLPSDLKRISPLLNDLALSHNDLSGTIPSLLLQHGPWVNLDLSFNKLSGTLPIYMFNFSANALTGKGPSLKLNINRISGTIPSVVVDAPNITILSGNVFACDNGNKSLLPTKDPDRTAYICGSDGANNAIFTLSSVVIPFLLVFLVIKYIHSEIKDPDQPDTLQRRFYTFQCWGRLLTWIKECKSTKPLFETFRKCTTYGEVDTFMKIFAIKYANQVEPPSLQNTIKGNVGSKYKMIRAFLKICFSLRRWLYALFCVIAFVLLPAEIGLTYYYSTLTETYIYLASASFLTGSIPTYVLVSIISLMVIMIFSRVFARVATDLLSNAINDLIPQFTVLSSINVFRLEDVITSYTKGNVKTVSNSYQDNVDSTNQQHITPKEHDLHDVLITIDTSEPVQDSVTSPIHKDIGTTPQTPETVCKDDAKLPWYYPKLRWAMFYLALFLILNFGLVMTVNMAYVYISSTAFNAITSDQKQIISIGVSIFKLIWNQILEYVFRILLWQNRNDKDGHSIDEELKFYSLLLAMSVFNNVAAPCTAILFFSPNCLYYTFVPSEAIVSSYSYTWVASTSENKLITLTAFGSFKFNSPFIYSDQCSSTLASAFSDVFLYRFLFGSWVFPMVSIALKLFHSFISRILPKVARYSCILNTLIDCQYFLYDWILPVSLQPCYHFNENRSTNQLRRSHNVKCTCNNSHYDDEDKANYVFHRMFLCNSSLPVEIFDIHLIATGLITDIAIIVTFGTVFPPLGLVGIASAAFFLIYQQCLMGRLVSWEELMYDPPNSNSQQAYFELRRQLLGKVNLECERFSMLLLHSFSTFLWPIVVLYFWAFFLFDIYADHAGTTLSYWILWLMLLGLPVGIIGSNKIIEYKKRNSDCFPKMTASGPSQEHSDQEMINIGSSNS